VRQKLATDVAAQITRKLADPLRALRDRLGVIVDQIERHVATSTGPAPYPWRSLQVLRQDLASTYVEVTQLARRIDELDRALGDAPADWFELASAVDHGLSLASDHFTPGTELLFDLGQGGARGAPGTFALVIAQLVAHCARSASEVAASTLTVRVVQDGAWQVVLIADNGGGSENAEPLGELVRNIVLPWGATLDAASAAGQGSSFELRLVAKP
jgi:signal transduction histidine kinase